MKEKLSRRELVGAIGAGIVVSACSETKNNNEVADPLKIKTCDNFGENAHKTKPVGPNYPQKFECSFIAILCIGLENDWTINVNHANFGLAKSEQDDGGRLGKALRALDATWKEDRRKPFSNNPDELKPRIRDDTGRIDEQFDLTKFRFKSPIELFVYIYHTALPPSGEKTIQLYDTKLISFGRYMQETNDQNVPIEAIGNCSYYHARQVELSKYEKLNAHGRMLRVENWARNKTGGDIKEQNIPHSMNIHFALPMIGSDVLMPMVFDPDTGNGTGNEP
jgi:hypothetical protein